MMNIGRHYVAFQLPLRIWLYKKNQWKVDIAWIRNLLDIQLGTKQLQFYMLWRKTFNCFLEREKYCLKQFYSEWNSRKSIWRVNGGTCLYPNTLEAETSGYLSSRSEWVPGHLGVQSEFQDIQDNKKNLCLKKNPLNKEVKE